MRFRVPRRTTVSRCRRRCRRCVLLVTVFSTVRRCQPREPVFSPDIRSKLSENFVFRFTVPTEHTRPISSASVFCFQMWSHQRTLFFTSMKNVKSDIESRAEIKASRSHRTKLDSYVAVSKEIRLILWMCIRLWKVGKCKNIQNVNNIRKSIKYINYLL